MSIAKLGKKSSNETKQKISSRLMGSNNPNYQKNNKELKRVNQLNFLENLEKFGSIQKAIEASNIKRNTFYTWMRCQNKLKKDYFKDEVAFILKKLGIDLEQENYFVYL